MKKYLFFVFLVMIIALVSYGLYAAYEGNYLYVADPISLIVGATVIAAVVPVFVKGAVWIYKQL